MNNFINKQKVLNRILEIIMIWVKNFKSVNSPSYIKFYNYPCNDINQKNWISLGYFIEENIQNKKIRFYIVRKNKVNSDLKYVYSEKDNYKRIFDKFNANELNLIYNYLYNKHFDKIQEQD